MSILRRDEVDAAGSRSSGIFGRVAILIVTGVAIVLIAAIVNLIGIGAVLHN
jgi:hypothetical protein